ncbi:CBL-interacting protein kinase 11 (OsCIPK11) [Durusdinium trenchii]|uniref:CBL-interacting protein kinase 11 (OsCIPK11) n=2 Tax=Durusdinium trenchii TaxID=1381693 RepID=A0ABP0HMH5_9DINO
MTNWDFDELDELEAKCPGPWPWPSVEPQIQQIPSKSPPGHFKPPPDAPPERPEVSGAHRILKAYRELALLHHPDKGGTDGEIFKLVQRAYEDGLIAVKRAEELALKAQPGHFAEDVQERQWPLHPAAAKVRVRTAVDQWEHDYDLGEVPSVPDDIPEVGAEQLAEWLKHGTAVVLDCRERIEVKRINAHLGNVVYVSGNQWGLLDLEKGTARAFSCYKYQGPGLLDAVTDTASQSRVLAADVEGTIWVFSVREKRDCKVEHRFPVGTTRAPLSLSSIRGFLLAVEKSRHSRSEVTVLNMTHVGKGWDDPARDVSPISWKRSSRPLRDWAVQRRYQEGDLLVTLSEDGMEIEVFELMMQVYQPPPSDMLGNFKLPIFAAAMVMVMGYQFVKQKSPFETGEDVKSCSPDDLQQLLEHLSEDSRSKLLDALGSDNSSKERVAEGAVSPASILTSFWRKKLGQEGSTGIPIVKAADLGVISRSAKKFEGKGGHDPWFGPTAFTVFGERWTLDDFLGAGAFGQSYLATHEPTGHRYVMKFLSRDNDRELKFLKQAPFQVFQHPNVITYVGLATHIGRGCESWNPARHIVVMEAIPNGELFDLITAEGAVLTDGTMRRLVHGIINGMAELCKYGVTHRDLKPDNLLIDENGQVVIIDLGCANLVQWLHEDDEGEEVGSPVRIAELKSQGSKFMREQTAAVGTDLYHAPEYGKKMYDSEKADVFTVGILVFLLRQPIPPFHSYFGGLKVITDEGAPAKWWSHKEFQAFAGDEGLKDLINCLWALTPEKRPTFQQLQAAMAGDEDILELYPKLRWLKGPLSGPLEYVREIRARRPNLSLKCTGVVEALALYNRGFESADAAFHAANQSGSGKLSATELTASLSNRNGVITAESVADLMNRYMSKDCQEMTLEQYRVMAKAWEFGGRPIVHDVGKMNSRHFAWSRRQNGSTLEQEIAEFTSQVSKAFTSAGYAVESVSNAVDAKNYENSSAFTVNMGSQLCRLRVSTFTLEEKLIVQSRRLWGSSVEELLMLQQMNNDLVEIWGSRVSPPSSLA